MTLEYLCILLRMLSSVSDFCKQETINISDYSYPKPDNDTSGIYRVAIYGTNDIHGAAFPLTITHPLTNSSYKYGGLEYLATYVKILRNEWKDRFLWLDSGDQFQGAIESRVSNGSIITDFFNQIQVNGTTIGNHEWDFGQPYLYQRLQSANWEYLAANIVNNSTNKTEFLPNTKVAKIYQVGKIKIGVIGLSTVETPFTTSGDLSNIKFIEYREVIISLSNLLKSKGANSIILTTHVGMNCKKDQEEKMILKMRNKAYPQAECNKQDEMNVLLNSLEPGVVDSVIAGHVHDVAHHWVNGIPVIQNINGGYYSNVLYLSFNSSTNEIIRDKIELEGPLPTCEKVFSVSRRCNFVNKTEARLVGDLSEFTFHNNLMKSDKSLDTLFQKWWEETKAYKVKIAYTEILLERNKEAENTLGNLLSDALKDKTNADLSIINPGSLRSSWFPGDLSIEHVFNMMPFENIAYTFLMNGTEVIKMLTTLQKGQKGFYQTSGIMQNVTVSPSKSLLSVFQNNGRLFEDDKEYKIGVTDFLLGGGDDFKDVFSWYKPRNVTEYGKFREHVIKYITNVSYISEGYLIDPTHKRLNVISQEKENKTIPHNLK